MFGRIQKRNLPKSKSRAELLREQRENMPYCSKNVPKLTEQLGGKAQVGTAYEKFPFTDLEYRDTVKIDPARDFKMVFKKKEDSNDYII